MPNEKCIYLDTYVLQKDMRIRLPKQILTNLDVKKGETLFDVYVDTKTKEIILCISNKN
ncbi:MAG: sucrose-6-phosphate hydrolase [Clostridiales bacterium]|nr:sucrose-6-phosphate hydrolase [Clostridiales bacterium]